MHKTKCALEGHLKSGRELHSLDDIIEWISVAAASGVVGNIAYDVLRQSLRSGGVRRIVRRRRHPGREVGQDDALNYLVKLAIREQCRPHGFPIPLFSDLVIRDWNPGAETAIAIVASDHHQIRAVVEIPYRDIEDYGLRVIIHRPVGERRQRSRQWRLIATDPVRPTLQGTPTKDAALVADSKRPRQTTRSSLAVKETYGPRP